ncbi:hypothetical protein [Cupriavidus sp. IDO]
MSPHFLAQPDNTVYVPRPRWFEAPGTAAIDPAGRSRRKASPPA